MQHQARKRFGQNFLHDRTIIERIIRSISPAADDIMLEIGPGLGALTQPILDKVNKLQVVEIDRDVQAILREQFVVECASEQLVIHGMDALKFDLETVSSEPHSIRVVGNLPYNISTPLIFHLMEHKHLIKDMYFMLQREVVDRMAADPGTKQYGRLGVMLAPYCDVTSLFDVGPGAFSPPPKVWSSIVRLQPWEAPPFVIDNHSSYARVVAAAFGQRRKTIRNSLKAIISAEELEAIGISSSARPEVISPADFAAIANHADKLAQG